MTILLGLRHPALLVRTLILARILSPSDFGLMAIVLIVTNLTQALQNFGLQGALIQRDQIDDRQLDTGWTVSVVRGVVAAIVVFLSAPLIGRYFEAPEAASIIRFAALAPLLAGTINIGVVHLDRDLDYRKKFVLQISSTVVQIVVSVTLAILFRNVWALVIGFVAGSATTNVLSHLLIPHRTRLRFSGEDFRSLLGFSGWLALTRYLRSISANLDFIIVGRLTDVATLGTYQMGWRISSVVTNAFNSVALPGISFSNFARLQNDPVRLRRGYQVTCGFVLSIALPLVAGIAVTAPLFTRIVLGEQWVGATGPMQVLAVASGLRAVRSQASSALLGIGEAKPVFFVDVITTGLLASSLLYLTPRHGAIGAAWAVLISLAGTIPIAYGLLHRRFSLDLSDLASPFAIPAIFTSVMVAGGLIINSLFDAANLLALAATGSGMAAIYLGSVIAAYRLDRGPIALLLGRDRRAETSRIRQGDEGAGSEGAFAAPAPLTDAEPRPGDQNCSQPTKESIP